MDDVQQTWEHLGDESLFEGKYRHVLSRKMRLPSGEEQAFEVVKASDSAVILPVTAEGLIITNDQYRIGPLQRQVELPGGIIDEGEDPLAAARRELQEETGYQGQLKHLISLNVEGFGTYKRHVFLAEHCVAVAAPDLQEEEDIIVRLMSRDDLVSALRSGKMDMADLPAVLYGFLALGWPLDGISN